MQKPTDPNVYWETFLTDDGEKCEFTRTRDMYFWAQVHIIAGLIHHPPAKCNSRRPWRHALRERRANFYIHLLSRSFHFAPSTPQITSVLHPRLRYGTSQDPQLSFSLTTGKLSRPMVQVRVVTLKHRGVRTLSRSLVFECFSF